MSVSVQPSSFAQVKAVTAQLNEDSGVSLEKAELVFMFFSSLFTEDDRDQREYYLLRENKK